MDKTEVKNTNSTLIKNIYDFLKNGDKQIKYSPSKDIVLLLGNTGSGKSTLTHYISGNAHKLLSQEVEEGTGEYVIVDQQDKISSASTIVSQTIYPDLVEDATTNTIYYDCPGFSDTRSAAHEIAATYFIKKVIDSASAVKMVFVVSHHSVTRGADRQDFILMLQHATDFIKQMDKFKNSIALVVTKIENRYIGNKLVSDEKVINTIGHYLEQAKRDIDEHPEMVNTAGKSSDSKEKVLSLLDIFLSKGENGQYTRIGIFRKPNEAGSISDIELMKQGKISLENLTNKNIQFIKVTDNDFGYTISAKSKVHISGLTEEINKTIVKQLLDIGREVKEHCIAQEGKNSDLENLISTFQNLREPFSKLQESAIKDTITPEMFIREIDTYIKNSKISISDQYIQAVQKEGDYINFLNLVSNKSIKNHKSSLLAAGLSNLTEYLNESHLFYNVLKSMHQRLSAFDIQKNRNKYNTIHVNELKDLFQSSIFIEIDTIFKEHSHMKEMKLGTSKLKLLNKVLDETLKYQIKIINPKIDKVIVRGVNVQLSDLSDLLNNNDIKFLEIYALNKMFIDTNFDLTGREIQMTIVAPVWEVIGNQSIILDGKPGMDHSPSKARSGTGYGENGFDGRPGEPGGPAGHFIGIGKHFINEEYLHISANGGNGGSGQDGGDGAEGHDGAHCPTSCRNSDGLLVTIFYNTDDAEYYGGTGGHGGNGGASGYGGLKGSIYIKKVGRESGMIQAQQTARDGYPGEIGLGGSSGKGGRYFYYKVRNYIGFVHTTSFEPINKWGRDGIPGSDGSNEWGRRDTWILKKLINLSNAVIEYKNYLLSNINNNLQESMLKTFLSEIDNNQTSVTQPTNRKRRNVINFTDIENSEEQLKNINMHEHDPTEIESQNNDRYVSDRKENYNLALHYHLQDSKHVPSNLFLETERIKQRPSKPIFPISVQLENMKTEKHTNINNQYSSINLHGNLLLSEMVLKKFMGKETWLNNDYKRSSKERMSSAHDLAYSYYLEH
ncbi:unnamed protein product [Nezara viridula]|uniref:AIG1-type G domain-containing protein n=1 Tax=Nezara viridula TaxID=85310 RepID=A0A9P0HQQ1_NEZVI|nr:unnamed protein product [Nezara viridula]